MNRARQIVGGPARDRTEAIPRGIVADEGYDALSDRDVVRKHGIVAIIPYRSNSKVPHRPMSRNFYKIRARIEQLRGKLKRFKRVAMRCEKTKASYASIVAVAPAFTLIKSIHRL
jgi:transposase